jgi:UDP-glucose 4-epimerase
MNTMVLGGSGFLGGAITEQLLRDGRNVGILDISGSQADCDRRFGAGAVEFISGDIMDRELLRERFVGVDEVFHLAGKLGTTELDDTPTAAVEVNVLGSINVFEAATSCGVSRVFHASKPNVWLNTYSITKHAAERFAEMYARAEACDTLFRSLRYFNAYGPRQACGPVRKLIPTFVAQALASVPLEIYGDGQQIVDLIYIDDLARLTVHYMRAPCASAGMAPDCGRGLPMTVNEVADAVNVVTGNTAGVRHLPMRRGEPAGTRLVAEMEPLLESVPGFRFTDWRESLIHTIDWYAVERVSV